MIVSVELDLGLFQSLVVDSLGHLVLSQYFALLLTWFLRTGWVGLFLILWYRYLNLI